MCTILLQPHRIPPKPTQTNTVYEPKRQTPNVPKISSHRTTTPFTFTTSHLSRSFLYSLYFHFSAAGSEQTPCSTSFQPDPRRARCLPHSMQPRTARSARSAHFTRILIATRHLRHQCPPPASFTFYTHVTMEAAGVLLWQTWRPPTFRQLRRGKL